MLPPEPRLPGARELLEQGLYFVVHAPRQTGKTTSLYAFARDLTAEGRHVALLFSCERGEATGDDYGAASQGILDAITTEAVAQRLPAELMPPSPWPKAAPASRLHVGLTAWAEACSLPIALFFDEMPITAEHVDEAKERLILARATHLDSLAAKLQEPRVRRFIEPILAGDEVAQDLTYNDDASYVRDLGLIARDRPIRIANPIYKEVIVRTLNAWARDSVTAEPL